MRPVSRLISDLGRGRIAAMAMLGAYFALLVALGGYYRWNRLGVPGVATKSFADMRSVTSAWECTRRGLSVIALNPCDPLKRPANYPRVWLLPAFLGLGEGSTVVLGIVAAVVFLIAAIRVLPRRCGVREGISYGAVLCSPCVMLGVERGNVDILVFALVVFAAGAVTRGRDVLGAATLLLAAVLKLFPLLAIGVLTRPRRRRLLAGVVLCLFAVYAAATFDDIRTIRRVVPQQSVLSYGINTIGGWIASATGLHSGNAWDVVLLAVAFGVALALARLVPNREAAGDEREWNLFAAGAGMYVFTFALFRSWDYRLAVLLLTIPQLLDDARRRDGVASGTIVAILVLTWLGTSHADTAVDVSRIAQLLVFVGLLVTSIRIARLDPLDRVRG